MGYIFQPCFGFDDRVDHINKLYRTVDHIDIVCDDNVTYDDNVYFDYLVNNIQFIDSNVNIIVYVC